MAMALYLSAILGAQNLQPGVGFGSSLSLSLSLSRFDASAAMADPALDDQREQPPAILRSRQTSCDPLRAQLHRVLEAQAARVHAGIACGEMWRLELPLRRFGPSGHRTRDDSVPGAASYLCTAGPGSGVRKDRLPEDGPSELFFAAASTIAAIAAIAAIALPPSRPSRAMALTVALSGVGHTGRFVGLCRIAGLRR